MTPEGRALVEANRRTLVQVGVITAAMLLKLGEQLQRARITPEEFITACVAAERLGHDQAAKVTASFVGAFRRAQDPDGQHAEPVLDEFAAGAAYGRSWGTVEDLTRLDRTQADFDAEFARIIAAAAVTAFRHVMNVARDTVAWSSAINGTRWRRVTGAKPCSFCVMLATRSDYRTKESALTVVGRARGYGTANYKATGQLGYGGVMARGVRKGQDRRRGTRAPGERYHDHCTCTVVEVVGDMALDAAEQAQHDLYQAAAEQCDADGVPRTGKNVMDRMKQLDDGSVIHDARKPATQAGGAGGGSKPPGRGGVSLASSEPDPTDRDAYTEYWRKRREALGIDYGRDADEIRPPEIRTVERLIEQGGHLLHIPTDHSARTSTSDYFWTPPGETIAHLVEIKSLEDATVMHKATFPMRIKKAVGKSLKHGEDKRKRGFIADAGDRPVTAEVRRALETFNTDNPGYEIDRLWLMSSGSTEEIRLA